MTASLAPRPLAALAALADLLGRDGAAWLLGGSAGRALLGYRVRPRDVDIEIAPGDAEALARRLRAPLAAAAGGGRASRRATLWLAGVEVDVTCDLAVTGASHHLAPDYPLQREWSHEVTVCGRTVRVAPVEETIARAVVLGDWDRLARIVSEVTADATPIRPDYVELRLSSATSSAAV